MLRQDEKLRLVPEASRFSGELPRGMIWAMRVSNSFGIDVASVSEPEVGAQTVPSFLGGIPQRLMNTQYQLGLLRDKWQAAKLIDRGAIRAEIQVLEVRESSLLADYAIIALQQAMFYRNPPRYV